MTALRDYLASRGINTDEDERTFVENSIRARQYLEQNRDQIRFAQQAAPHWNEFQQFLQQKQQAEAQKKAEEQAARWYSKADWDPGLSRYILRDEEGNLRVADGADPSILARYQQAVMHQQETIRKFAEDPVSFLQPFEQRLEQRLIEKVKEMVTGELLGPRDQVMAADRIVQEIKPHLFTTDANGQTVPTVFGLRYNQLAHDAARLGINDPERMHAYAIQHIQAEHAFYKQHGGSLWGQNQAAAPANGNGGGQTPAQVANEQAKQRYTQSAQRAPSRTGALRSSAGGDDSELAGLTIRERMQRAFAEVDV